MFFRPRATLAVAAVAHGLRDRIFHLGALGFIPLVLLDSSVVPVPGSMDILTILTILLSARERDLWPYYACMATLGSVIGALVTYRIARRGGQEALSKTVKRKTLRKVQQLFDRWGLGAIAIPAVLPPPVPMVPFVLTAGAMQYPVKKFVFALSLGRAVRYGLLAFLAGLYKLITEVSQALAVERVGGGSVYVLTEQREIAVEIEHGKEALLQGFMRVRQVAVGNCRCP